MLQFVRENLGRLKIKIDRKVSGERIYAKTLFHT